MCHRLLAMASKRALIVAKPKSRMLAVLRCLCNAFKVVDFEFGATYLSVSSSVQRLSNAFRLNLSTFPLYTPTT